MGTAGVHKSRFRGVSFDKKKRKWRVQIKVRVRAPWSMAAPTVSSAPSFGALRAAWPPRLAL